MDYTEIGVKLHFSKYDRSIELISYYNKYDLLRWRHLVKSVVYCQVFNRTKN